MTEYDGRVLLQRMEDHQTLDDARFTAVNKSLAKLEGLAEKAVYGIVGAVFLAIANLIFKH